MRRSLVPFTSALAALTALSYTSVAAAQDAKTVATTVVVTETGNDHDVVVGHFAVGYFGVSNIPITGGTTGNGTATVLTSTPIVAPVIGARYWISQKLGIDAGIGFNATNANGWGLAIHGGVPLALATSRHMTFELIPEATVAFANNNSGPGSVSESGFLLDVGARIGGEIQFGFIGIPQLALQASVGLYLQHTSLGISGEQAPVPNTNSTTFTTSVQSDPWGIFTDNISALYYF